MSLAKLPPGGIVAVVIFTVLALAVANHLKNSSNDKADHHATPVTVRDTVFVHDTLVVWDTVSQEKPAPGAEEYNPGYPHEYTLWFVNGTKETMSLDSTLGDLRSTDVLLINNGDGPNKSFYIMKNILKVEYRKR